MTSRDVINTKITTTLDTATDKWGIKVNRVELKNILPPAEIQDAMEKQMKAERQRRESILRAEGQKRSQVLIAEGEKEAAILKAEAEKQSAILKADAVREAKIREADGEATAILKVQQAYADSLKMLNEAAPTDKVLTLKSFEALAKSCRWSVHQTDYPKRHAVSRRSCSIGKRDCYRQKDRRNQIVFILKISACFQALIFLTKRKKNKRKLQRVFCTKKRKGSKHSRREKYFVRTWII